MEELKEFENVEKNLKSMINVLNTTPETTDEMEQKRVVVNFNAETGVQDIMSDLNEENLEEPELGVLNSIDDVNVDEELELDNSPVSDEEIKEVLENDSIIEDLSGHDDLEISVETTKELLELINKKLAGQKVHAYKDMPKEIQKMIDNHISEGLKDVAMPNGISIQTVRKNIGEALLDDFINEIQLKRMKNDFATDLENLYKDSIKDIAAGTLEYIDERNKAYRQAADEIDDPEKKKKMLSILDQLDEARSLNGLKEYAKHCKIKSIELEKPDNRVYMSFLAKYKNSSQNIYDINLAKKVLFRHLESSGYGIRDIDAFFICFCKQVKNYSPAKPIEHVYMYYVLYYCALLDGDNSDVFINNVKEVMDNLRQRNAIIKR